ncbi:agnoprotein [Rhinolophus ferrumequinum polyomavirus 3]|nr:agnoprotein [Rhinolophus ferrumequinum polyomavirus 3]BBG62087.1 agnoprotein [Rhinolophus ferrumequinum polyomavirus 3]
MGKALRVLWQTVKLLLRIYNMSQPTTSAELMGQIIQLFQEMIELLKTLKDSDLCRDIYWELGVFKQKMHDVIEKCKSGVQHIDLKATYFSSKSEHRPLLADSHDMVDCAGVAECPPLCGLADSPDSLAPGQHCSVSLRKLAEDQAWSCEEVESCEECQNLRQCFLLAERLSFLAGEIQTLVARRPLLLN